MKKCMAILRRAGAIALRMALAMFLAMPAAGAEFPLGVLRVGVPLVAETLDPARADNGQAFAVMAGIYDTLFVLDPVARPTAIVPSAAAALPEVSADFRTVTVRVRPGIYFTAHPAFGGRPRELSAAEFAYAFRRVLDPRVRSPGVALLKGKIEGLDALARRAQDAGRAIDYDAPVSGLTLVDRDTLRIRLNAPDPTFPFLLASTMLAGTAREVVEAEGDRYGQRPVAPGASWSPRYAGPAHHVGSQSRLPVRAVGGSADAGLARDAVGASHAGPQAARPGTCRAVAHARSRFRTACAARR